MNFETTNILVVDDSPAFQKIVADMLMQRGYRVTCASSGEDAIKLFAEETFNLVLTDIILPGMSGLNLLKMIKDIRPVTDVVIITGNASSFTAIKALRLGAYDYIVKPIDDDTILYNVVERTLERQTLTLENRRLINDLSEKNRALESTLNMMKALNRACAMIASTLDISEIMGRLVQSAVEQLRATKGYLLLHDKGSKSFIMKGCVGIDRHIQKTFSLSEEKGISGLVAATNKPLRIEANIPMALTQRILEEDHSGELFSSPGILSIPLRVKDRVVGVVCISGRADGKMFTDAEVEFVSTIANHAAIALDNAGTLYKLKKKE